MTGLTICLPKTVSERVYVTKNIYIARDWIDKTFMHT